MNSLFDDNFKYTDRATILHREVKGLLQSMYRELLEEGYSPREVTLLVLHAATQAEVELVSDWEVTKAPSQQKL